MDIFVMHNIFLRDQFHFIPSENWDFKSLSAVVQLLCGILIHTSCVCLCIPCRLANSCVFPLVGYFNPAIVRVLSELNTFANSHKARVLIKQKEEKGNKDKTEVLIRHCHIECK